MTVPSMKESLAGIEHNLDRISKKLTTVNNNLAAKPKMLTLTDARKISGVSNAAFKLLCTGARNDHGFTMPIFETIGRQLIIDQNELIDWIVINRAAIDTYIKTRHAKFSIPA